MAKHGTKEWFLYLIRTRQGSLYAGVTTDVTRRFGEHEIGRGAKYLRSKKPLELVYQVQIGSRSKALKAEYRIKKMSKQKKEGVVFWQLKTERLLEVLAL